MADLGCKMTFKYKLILKKNVRLYKTVLCDGFKEPKELLEDLDKIKEEYKKEFPEFDIEIEPSFDLDGYGTSCASGVSMEYLIEKGFRKIDFEKYPDYREESRGKFK